MNIITGRTGKPHITSQQMRDTNIAVIGQSDCVLNVGRNLTAEQLDANTVRIYDGQLSLQGCIASIDAGEYEDFIIENGTIGYERIDYIVAHYQKKLDEENNIIESVSLEVEKSNLSTPIVSGVQIAPAKYVNDLNIRDNANDYYFRLYAILIRNLNIESITPMFEIYNFNTGWLPVAYNENFKSYANGQELMYRKDGNAVEIRGTATPTQILPLDDYETSYTIGTIPSAYAPSSMVRRLCQGSRTAVWLLCINENGEITISRYRNGTAIENLTPNIWLPINEMYLI